MPPEMLRQPNSFFTKIAGVTFEGRQRIISRCSEGEQLVLRRDPINRFDEGAIKVLRLNGEQLGFIPEHVSRCGDPSGLAFQMDRGSEYSCRIKNLTGGGPGQGIGVNIEIIEKLADTQSSRHSKLDSMLPGRPRVMGATVEDKSKRGLLWICLAVGIGGGIWWIVSR
jgi:hypothetical protein